MTRDSIYKITFLSAFTIIVSGCNSKSTTTPTINQIVSEGSGSKTVLSASQSNLVHTMIKEQVRDNGARFPLPPAATRDAEGNLEVCGIIEFSPGYTLDAAGRLYHAYIRKGRIFFFEMTGSIDMETMKEVCRLRNIL